MAKNCPTCNTELPETHPALVVQKLLDFIAASGGWNMFENYSVGDMVPGLPDVQVVALKTTYDTGDIETGAYYSDSALPQGAEFETYVVFRIGELFYKKTGTGDSYGDVEWNGDLRQVQATPKTVWEYK